VRPSEAAGGLWQGSNKAAHRVIYGISARNWATAEDVPVGW